MLLRAGSPPVPGGRTIDVAIIVTDVSPLTTLAAAKSLDYRLYPKLPVIIPGTVFHEATAAAGKLGAEDILNWYRPHTEQVRVEPTAVFREEMVLREVMPSRRPARDLGERAAIEGTVATRSRRTPKPCC